MATDPNLHAITVTWRGAHAGDVPLVMIDHVLLGSGPAIVHPSVGPVAVRSTGGGSDMALCRSLVHG